MSPLINPLGWSGVWPSPPDKGARGCRGWRYDGEVRGPQVGPFYIDFLIPLVPVQGFFLSKQFSVVRLLTIRVARVGLHFGSKKKTEFLDKPSKTIDILLVFFELKWSPKHGPTCDGTGILGKPGGFWCSIFKTENKTKHKVYFLAFNQVDLLSLKSASHAFTQSVTNTPTVEVKNSFNSTSGNSGKWEGR